MMETLNISTNNEGALKQLLDSLINRLYKPAVTHATISAYLHQFHDFHLLRHALCLYIYESKSLPNVWTMSHNTTDVERVLCRSLQCGVLLRVEDKD